MALVAMMVAAEPHAAAADTLRGHYRDAVERLRSSALPGEMLVDSAEADGRLRADVLAVVEHGFGALQQAFDAPSAWCGVLILQPNVRHCVVSADGTRLTAHVAKRFDEPLEDARPVEFRFVAGGEPGVYLQARLHADEGPLGTRDHLLVLEAIPLDEGRSFLRLHFSQRHGFLARLAARTYLATSGRDKVGFSVTGTAGDGSPQYVDGLRGAVERNAMRYFLAVDSVLEVRDRPAPERREASLLRWLDAIERYPQQLAEEDPQAYLDAKRSAS